MKRITNSLILFLILVCPFLTQCTQPDGNIGDWFGSWYLEEILIDGETDETYQKNKENNSLQVMVSFQGKIFNMAYISGSEIYGSWSYAGEILTLNATYHSGSGYDSPSFNPFPIVLHFPEGLDEIEITVTKIEKKIMQWQYIDQNGSLLTYNFRKYP